MASSETSAPADESNSKGRLIVAGGAILLAIVVVVGIWSVIRFVDQQREHELHNWQVRLGIVADSRTAAVEDWLGEQFSTLAELSENASLQLYMTELTLQARQSGASALDIPEGSYLRNLLVVTAEGAGFTAPTRGGGVAANVEPAGQAGIAITDPLGNLLVATPQMPPVGPAMKRAMRDAASSQRGLMPLHVSAAGNPTMGFVVPVYGVQQDTSSEHIGFIVGIRVVGRDLYKRLEQPGETDTTPETYLVRREGNLIEYLSPLADGSDPLERRLAADTPELAAAFVVEHPGGFAVKRDYRGNAVLVTGRALGTAPWYLVRKIDRTEALAESEQRQKTLLTVFLLLIFGVAGAIVAVWRHGASVRSRNLMHKFRQASQRLEEYSQFMEVVTDTQPTAICVVDEEGHYAFANKTAAQGTGIGKKDMLGKSISAVLGPVRAKELEAANREALRDNTTVSRTHRFEEGGHVEVVRSDHLPLASEGSRSVLMVLHDITAVVRERERREQIMRDLIKTLVAIVDQRDRFSAYQSTRVAEVSVAIAREMGLGDREAQTVDYAGYLVNLGKIMVPKELLMKSGALTDEERDFVRRSIQTSADLLDSVDFDLPVQDTLRQIQENWDGSGYPNGLHADAILVTARIIAVANAFVGMVSPRAYRNALSFEKASEILLAETGSKFDRRVVTALINFLENRNGKQQWAHYQKAPAESAAAQSFA